MDKINRIIDANCNRTREGLRVIEEIIRFWLENAPSFHTIKQLRHHFTALETQIRSQLTHVMTARQSDQDVGKHYIPNL
ncbi:hypothetical protein KDK77_10755, partial [bacterium]|nr:hypothetical protein [bacterium]